MKIVRARHLGMCFGVRDAIALAVKTADSQPLTILGDLVHNETVLRDLEDRGIRVRGELHGVETPSVMVTAHGVSGRRLAAARDQGLSVVDATCPLVRVAHRAVTALARDGFHPVIIGKRDHVEVRGLTEDLPAFDVVLDAADVCLLEPRSRFGVAAQTTQPVSRVQHLTSLIRLRFPKAEVRLVDTVCAPTKRRQESAVELAQQCDVTIVVGGAQSNNTRELVATCEKHCARVHHVQGPDDLQAEWFRGARAAGITAGTSTPDAVVDLVEARMRDLARRRRAAA